MRALLIVATWLAATSTAAAQLEVELADPGALTVGDRAEVIASVRGAASHPLLLTPRAEGTALEVVRGRLLRADARDPDASVLELRIPVVARRAGTSVLRVSVSGYACEARCRRVEATASLVVRVRPQASQKRAKQARSSSLGWVRLPGAESCLGAAALARRVEARLGRDVFVSAADAGVSVEGRAERTEGEWRAVIAVEGDGGEALGERTLSSRAESCDELGEMVVTVVALTIDPLTAPEEPPPPREVVRTERVEVPVEVPVEVEAPRWRVEIDASGVGALGLTPGPTLGGLTAVIVEPPGFVPLVLEGALLPFTRASDGVRHADFLHAHAGLQICPLALRDEGLALHGCVGADAGAVFVVGGDANVTERERVTGFGHAALRGHWDVVGPLTVRLGLHLLVPFRHDPFVADGVAFYRPDPIAGFFDLGVGVHLE